jgi:hypothetical protein
MSIPMARPPSRDEPQQQPRRFRPVGGSTCHEHFSRFGRLTGASSVDRRAGAVLFLLASLPQ